MRKLILGLICFYVSTCSYGFTVYELPKVKKFVLSKKLCKVAIGLNDTQEFIQRNFTNELYGTSLGGSFITPKENSDFKPNALTGIPAMSSFVCLQDLVHDGGSINERSGCTFIWYSLNENQYTKTIAFSNKDCSKGGYDELIPQIKDFVYKATVGFGSAQIESDPLLMIFGVKNWSLVYSENKSISDLFMPHLNSDINPTKAQLDSWINFLKSKKEALLIKQKREQVIKDHKQAVEKKGEDKKSKDKKTMEKLYE